MHRAPVRHVYKLLVALGLTILSCPIVCLGDEVQDNVDRLVRDLNSDQLSERDQAEAALIKLGPAALKSLPSELDKLPAETAQRLRRIRTKLEHAQADESAQAGLVTLSAKNQPLSEVLKAILDQTGNKVVDYRAQFNEDETEKKITLELAKAPFWKALDQLLDQAGMTVYAYGDERGTFIVTRPPGQVARSVGVSYSGPFRVEAVRVEGSRELRLQKAGSLKLLVAIAWEPRLAPIAISHPLEGLQITGDSGEKLAVDGSEGQPEAEIQDMSSTVELELPLVLPPRSITKIARLTGKFHALLPGPVEEFRFTRLTPSKPDRPQKIEKRKGDVTVGIERLRQNNEIWECTLRVAFGKPSAGLETHRGWILANEVYFVDPSGKQTPAGGYELVSQSANEVGIKYLFELPEGLKGLSLVYKTPLTIQQIPVSYELQGIELP